MWLALTPAAWTHLHELSCDNARGFIVSRSLPRAELEAWSPGGGIERALADAGVRADVVGDLV